MFRFFHAIGINLKQAYGSSEIGLVTIHPDDDVDPETVGKIVNKDWMTISPAGEVLFRAGYPSALWVNWHLAHCINHGESVDEAYRHVKGRVGHVHVDIRDGLVDRQADLLAAENYPGYFSVEVMPKEGESAVEILRAHADWWKGISAR